MKKNIIVATMVLLFVLFFSNSVFADCVSLSRTPRWSRIDSHTIIISGIPKVLLKIPYCHIYSTSNVRLIDDYVCNGDEIMIDGKICDIRNVVRL